MNRYYFLFLLIIITSAKTFPADSKRVLVLHSYNVGLSWTEDITRGIVERFQSSYPDGELFFEYLDSKRIEDPLFYRKTKEILQLKYKPDYFDIIISSDNSAFEFLLQYKDELFPKTPVVFCGVNNFRKEMLNGVNNITGVAEFIDITGALDVIKSNHPNTDIIAVISDTTITSKENKKLFLQIMPLYGEFQFIFMHEVRQTELIKDINKLPQKTVLVLLSSIYDDKGVFMSFEKSAEIISQNCEYPIYGFWNFFMGHGVVGGKMLRGYDQGVKAGELAIRILNGEDPDNIPIVHNTATQYIFDYKQLQRFNIDPLRLPVESSIINEPEQNYTINRVYVWLIIFATAVSSVIMLYLLVNMRKRKRTEKDLMLKKLEAEKSDKLKSEFLAQISHEIRTPINTILNFTSLLRDELHDKVEGDLRSSFRIIENAGRRTIRTIDLILNMSEVQTGFYEPQFKRIDIAKDVLEKIYVEFKPMAESKDLKFNLVKLTDSTFVMADEYSVFQIFVNLIDNAFKYTPKGKIEIIVFRNYADKLSVGIVDTGVGIGKDYMYHLFQPFTQEEQGYTRKFEGNGLGLALVKKYVELNNAVIKVESEKDKGSRFTVSFNS